MTSDPPARAFACVLGVAVALLAGCSGGDGTGPPPDDEEATQQLAAAELATAAAAEFEQLVAAGDPDPVGALVASLQANPDVAQVERFDEDATVIATLTNGVPFSLSLAEKQRPEWTAVPAGELAESFQPPTASLGITCDTTNYPQSKKACIVGAYQQEFGQDLGPINASLTRAGYQITPFALKTPQDLATLRQQLSTCGVLYIASHGARMRNLVGKAGNSISTEIQMPSDIQEFRAQLAQMKQALGDDYRKFLAVGGSPEKARWVITPEFFATTQYPNTLVYVDACSSDGPIPDSEIAAGGKQLRSVFRQQGAGAFLGWTAPIGVQVSNMATEEIFNALAPKTATIEAVAVSVSPPDPGPGEAYVPSATISPAQAGVEVSLSVRGTDGFTRDETGTTDAGGTVTFASVPGGQGEVIDSLTVVAGGAGSSATAYAAVQNSPALRNRYALPWFLGGSDITALNLDARTLDFNLVCNNQKLTRTVAIVKF